MECGSHLWRASQSREVGKHLSGCEKEGHTKNAGGTGALSRLWGPGTFARIPPLAAAPVESSDKACSGGRGWVNRKIQNANCPGLIP